MAEIRFNKLFRMGGENANEIQQLMPIRLLDTVHNDLEGPLSVQRISETTGRLTVDYYNAGVKFASNARYPEEPVLIEKQLTHEWKEGTNGLAHLHWKQRSADIPNWLLAYRVHVNNTADTLETDFTNFSFLPVVSQVFTYPGSGVFNQISRFGTVDLSSATLSSIVQWVLFRDTANTSGLFAGADPSALDEYATSCDMHIEIDTPGGSYDEFDKGD